MAQRPVRRSNPHERVAIFIDGWNFKYATYDSFGIQIDYIKLLDFFCEDSILIRAYYYTGEWDDVALDHYIRLTNPTDPQRKRADLLSQRDDQRKFWRFLDRNGYRVIRKPIRVFRNGHGEVKVKADLDLDLAIDMLTLSGKCDKQIIMSGDRDFVPLVDAVGRNGVRVVVVSTQHPEAFRMANYRASDDLLDAADEFVSVETIRELVER